MSAYKDKTEGIWYVSFRLLDRKENAEAEKRVHDKDAQIKKNKAKYRGIEL